MAKALKTGGEVDSFCTKCRMMLNHRIIAMVGPKPVRVECSTCGSHHNFREYPPGEAPRATSSGSKVSAVGAGPRAPRVSHVAKAEQERRDREQQWEKAIAGKAMGDFKRYNVGGTFTAGELIRHAKFGDGVVTRVIDANKVEILFKDEARTLAQGLA